MSTHKPEVLPPGLWENNEGPKSWWAVSTETSGGIIAYFRDEDSAWAFVREIELGRVRP